MELRERIVQLFRKTATELPEDIISALKEAYKKESPIGKDILSNIIKNIEQAKIKSRPICQDTGTPFVHVKHPREYSQKELRKVINEAADIATKEVPLRPNAVDTLTGENIGNVPIIYFEEADELKIDLLLKGGGSENVSAAYQLPNKELDAHRDLDGVKKCIIDAVFKAQGKGCPPYIVGIATGGNIEDVAHRAKKQLLRKIDDNNTNPELEKFEKEVTEKINSLGIGPMGLGGSATVLGVKATGGIRHPASFFVGVSISCWCLRRQSL